ncbi:uncharacterized protein LOC106162834 [Lingula anatina]|uniref:Uncharacterized protein LOC106162834 n=1 Tax=Lingula anatina TaxID=7574 RepID=A0A1S3IE37_LINAN|nr:uncharacterized protein LOC106162834 [Lingula anatina]|eukprot:XP_013395719.1 uncharacterized protein LOC106162834 [Lingula anatina]
MLFLLMAIAVADIAVGDERSGFPRPAGFWPLTKRYHGLDVSGNGNHALVQDVDFNAGIYGIGEGSAKFAGTVSSFIEIPNNGALNVNSFTWLAYVRLRHMSDEAAPLFDFRRSEGNNVQGIGIWAIMGIFYICPVMDETTCRSRAYSLPVLTDAAWVYAGFTYDAQTGMTRMWVDGVEAGHFQHTPQLNLTTDTPVRIGARHSSDRDAWYFFGALRCVQWYGVALSAEQIQQTVNLCREPVHGAHFKVHRGYAMATDSPLTYMYRSEQNIHCLIQCSALCSRDYNCLSVNYLEATSTCELSKYSTVYNSSLQLTRRSEGEVHAELLHPVNMLSD